MRASRSHDVRIVNPPLIFACALGAFAFGIVHFLGAKAEERVDDSALLMPLILSLALLAFTAVMAADRRPRDPLLIPLMALVAGIGFALLHHVRPDLTGRQLVSFVIGIVLTTAIARMRDVRRLARYRYTCAGLAVLLLLLVIIFGRPLGPRGDIRLAISLGIIEFQPADFVRILIVIFLAGFLAEKHEALTFAARRQWMLSRDDARYLGPMLAAWGLTMLLLITQRDLGAALLMFGIFVGMLYIGSARAVYLAIGIVAFIGGAYLCAHEFPVVRERLEIWWNPWKDAQGKGYQIVQSLYALAGGGLYGAGLGHGAAALVPAVHTDLIFAAVAEELGLLGAGAVILTYMLLVYRGFRIAARAQEPVNALIANGLSLALALQVFVIIGGVTKLTPLTGITLPFMSFGGSSLVANCILIGILLSISGES